MVTVEGTNRAGGEKSGAELGERAGVLLKGLVESYLLEGQPVGSRLLSAKSGLGLSSATVRHVLAELEQSGYLASPHTSAGRVPTQLGLRHFVDSLLTVEAAPAVDAARLQQGLNGEAGEGGQLATTSGWLAEVSNLVGLVRGSGAEFQRLRRVEFMDLGGGQTLAVLVTREGTVHNKLIQQAGGYRPALLEQAANYLNREFVGKSMAEIRRQLLDEITRLKDSVDDAMARLLLAAEALPERQDEVLISGESNLVASPELSDRTKLSALFAAFEGKCDLLGLFDNCLSGDGVQIFIGAESGFAFLGDCSVVTAPYHQDGEVVGVLGVIGPTRMPYGALVPLVDISAQMLSAALNQPR